MAGWGPRSSGHVWLRIKSGLATGGRPTVVEMSLSCRTDRLNYQRLPAGVAGGRHGATKRPRKTRKVFSCVAAQLTIVGWGQMPTVAAFLNCSHLLQELSRSGPPAQITFGRQKCALFTWAAQTCHNSNLSSSDTIVNEFHRKTI